MTTELFSLAASVVSAMGGGFAAWAAFRSAGSAREAQKSAEESERRASLRRVSETASAVSVEADRILIRGERLKLGYRSLFTLSGGTNHSKLPQYLDVIEEKMRKAAAFGVDASLFAGEPKLLAEATAEDVDRVQLRLAHSLVTVRGIREDLEREETGVESQCAELRESMDRTRLAR